MSYQVLARKWRPKRFEEVLGQKHVTSSLRNAILENRLGHAYLLTGTRGIGKTSVARIFAKALRCEQRLKDGNPCNQCSNCLEIDDGTSIDVLELDAASNNSVDDIRQIVENVQYLPSSGSYKVYIIDEVHMLSVNAFNALLKTLEEPPAHVIFIMATTEVNKLLGTVLSRCQRFDFRHATHEDLAEHIKKLAQKENFNFTHNGLVDEIAKLGRGSFRDTLSLLDQVLSFCPDREVTEEIVVQSLGIARISAVKNILAGIISGNVENVGKVFREMTSENISVQNILTAILDQLFSYIENVDDEKKANDILPLREDADLPISELFWIYETISKDSSWVIDSITPESSAIILLKKVAMRRELLTTSKPVKKKKVVTEKIETEKIIEEPKAIEIKEPARPIESVPAVAEKVETQQENIQEEKKIEEPKKEVKQVSAIKSWDGFLQFLEGVSPAMVSNLEQGNTIGELDLTSEQIKIDLGFTNAAKLFLDYLSEQEVTQKLKSYLGQYFQVELSKINLNLKMVTEPEENNFVSKVDIEKRKIEDDKKQKEDELRNHPMILKAQEMFKNDLDKVIIVD